MRKSLYTVTKREDIQATQQLNSTNEPGDKRKAECRPEVFAGKSKQDWKYQMSWEHDFPWLKLVHKKEKSTMKCKICCSFPKIADKSSFLFIGKGALKRTTIQAHAKSKTHYKCYEANSARENPGAAPTCMRTVLRNMNAQSYEECPNYSYFMPSKLWKQCPRLNIDSIIIGCISYLLFLQKVKTNKPERTKIRLWLYYALYQSTPLRSPQRQKPMHCRYHSSRTVLITMK